MILKDNMSDRNLNPGDLLIRRYESSVIDISLVTHTSSNAVANAVRAECITIFVTTWNETDRLQMIGLLRDRSQCQDGEIAHAEI